MTPLAWALLPVFILFVPAAMVALVKYAVTRRRGDCPGVDVVGDAWRRLD